MRVLDITLQCHDLAAAGDFYKHTLDLPLLEWNTGTVSFAVGGSLLTFTKASGRSRPFYHFAINIPANLFGEAVDWLAARTSLLRDNDGRERFHFDWMNADAVYFEDPAGNIGELIARHGAIEHNQPPFGPQHLLEISEVGLPVADVPRAFELLSSQFALEAYIPASRNFGAPGDAHGMFILVKKGRGWLPDGRGSAIHPLQATIEGPHTARYQFPEEEYVIEQRYG
ncbi:MAG: hypothetical protein MAG453_00370 [Calditrichaeota bacterium]|nr:hypothetical protein [Calditrichota bacterium]